MIGRRAFHRYMALTTKEFQQMRRNRRLLVQLTIPPTVVLLFFGYALNPEVKNLRTGIVDESLTPQSRELQAALTSNKAFKVIAHYASPGLAEAAIRRRELDLAIVVSADFARDSRRGRQTEIQVLLDAVNANTAGIAQAYLSQALSAHMASSSPRLMTRPVGPGISLKPIVLFNPGLVNSWLMVTAIMGILMFINGSLVASALAVREKELGTIEQLLMSPAQTLELLLAKTTPVFVVLYVVLFLALTLSCIVFGLPIRGPLFALLVASGFAALAGIGIGILMATFTASTQQSQLLAFFINPPMVTLSGAFSPIENMPPILHALSYLNPLRYLLEIIRGVTVKGAGFADVWPQIAALAAFATVLYGLSVIRYRRQLG